MSSGARSRDPLAHPGYLLNSDHEVLLYDLVFEPAVNAFQAARESM